MKSSVQLRTSVTLVIVLLTMLLGLVSALVAKDEGHRSAQELRAAYEKALGARDTNGVVALTHWEGVAPEMKKRLIELIDVDSVPINVKLVPLPSDFDPNPEFNGIRHRPNVEIVGMIEVKYEESESRSYMSLKAYGKKGDRFYFPGVIEENIPPIANEKKKP